MEYGVSAGQRSVALVCSICSSMAGVTKATLLAKPLKPSSPAAKGSGSSSSKPKRSTATGTGSGVVKAKATSRDDNKGPKADYSEEGDLPEPDVEDIEAEIAEAMEQELTGGDLPSVELTLVGANCMATRACTLLHTVPLLYRWPGAPSTGAM